MWYKLALVLLCLVSPGCSYKYIAPEFQTYTGLFDGIYNLNCKNKISYPKIFTVHFVPQLQKPYIGFCLSPNKDSRLILISRKSWDNLDEDHRFALVFHEMGHCILDLDHVKDENNYMYYRQPTSITKIQVYDQYVQDVKRSCK